MKFEIDLTNRTIIILEDCSFKELYDFVGNLSYPGEWTIRPHTVDVYKVIPYKSNPLPNTWPWNGGVVYCTDAKNTTDTHKI